MKNNNNLETLKNTLKSFYDKAETEGVFCKKLRNKIVILSFELGLNIDNTYPFNFSIKYDSNLMNKHINTYIQLDEGEDYKAVFNGIDYIGQYVDLQTAIENNNDNLTDYLWSF